MALCVAFAPRALVTCLCCERAAHREKQPSQSDDLQAIAASDWDWHNAASPRPEDKGMAGAAWPGHTYVFDKQARARECGADGSPECHTLELIDVLAHYKATPGYWNNEDKKWVQLSPRKCNAEDCDTGKEGYDSPMKQFHAGDVLQHSLWASMQVRNWCLAKSAFALPGVDCSVAEKAAFAHDIAKGGHCAFECVEEGTETYCFYSSYRRVDLCVVHTHRRPHRFCAHSPHTVSLLRSRLSRGSPLNYDGQDDAAHPEYCARVILGLQNFYAECPAWKDLVEIGKSEDLKKALSIGLPAAGEELVILKNGLGKGYADEWSRLNNIGVTLKDNGDGRVVVSNVLEPSAGKAAGLAVGDVLLSVQGEPCTNSQQAKDMLTKAELGEVAVRVERPGHPTPPRPYRTILVREVLEGLGLTKLEVLQVAVAAHAHYELGKLNMWPKPMLTPSEYLTKIKEAVEWVKEVSHIVPNP